MLKFKLKSKEINAAPPSAGCWIKKNREICTEMLAEYIDGASIKAACLRDYFAGVKAASARGTTAAARGWLADNSLCEILKLGEYVDLNREKIAAFYNEKGTSFSRRDFFGAISRVLFISPEVIQITAHSQEGQIYNLIPNSSQRGDKKTLEPPVEDLRFTGKDGCELKIRIDLCKNMTSSCYSNKINVMCGISPTQKSVKLTGRLDENGPWKLEGNNCVGREISSLFIWFEWSGEICSLYIGTGEDLIFRLLESTLDCAGSELKSKYGPHLCKSEILSEIIKKGKNIAALDIGEHAVFSVCLYNAHKNEFIIRQIGKFRRVDASALLEQNFGIYQRNGTGEDEFSAVFIDGLKERAEELCDYYIANSVKENVGSLVALLKINNIKEVGIEDAMLDRLCLRSIKRSSDGRLRTYEKDNRSQERFFRILIQTLIQELDKSGIVFVRVSAANTSNYCSECGKLINGADKRGRIFKCSACGAEMDRDVNASLNILNNLVTTTP